MVDFNLLPRRLYEIQYQRQVLIWIFMVISISEMVFFGVSYHVFQIKKSQVASQVAVLAQRIKRNASRSSYVKKINMSQGVKNDRNEKILYHFFMLLDRLPVIFQLKKITLSDNLLMVEVEIDTFSSLMTIIKSIRSSSLFSFVSVDDITNVTGRLTFNIQMKY